MKIAGAPISWGVCEVPNWGYQMTPERVLTEMKQIGLICSEQMLQEDTRSFLDFFSDIKETTAKEARTTGGG